MQELSDSSGASWENKALERSTKRELGRDDGLLHCHKPDEHHLHDHTNEEAVAHKGYAAGNRLQVSEGEGFVDLTSFLLKEQDCEGAQVGQLILIFISSERSFFNSSHSMEGLRAQRRRSSLPHGSIVDTTAQEENP